MISLPIGLLAFAAIVFFAGFHNSGGLYANSHALLIVGCGTLAVLASSNPLPVLRALVEGIRGLFRSPPSVESRSGELVELARARATIASDSSKSSDDPLVSYALGLWRKGVAKELFETLLLQRKEALIGQDQAAVQALRNLSKYPPALGMLGTVMGLIGLFSELNAEKKGLIGPSLAVALTATFYGLLAANAIVLPLADRLYVCFVERQTYLDSVYEILVLINRGEPALIVEGEVKAREAA